MEPLITATFDDTESEEESYRDYRYSSGQISGYSSGEDMISQYIERPDFQAYSPEYLFEADGSPPDEYANSSSSSSEEEEEEEEEKLDTERHLVPGPGDEIVDMIRNIETTCSSELVQSVSDILRHALDQAKSNNKN